MYKKINTHDYAPIGGDERVLIEWERDSYAPHSSFNFNSLSLNDDARKLVAQLKLKRPTWRFKIANARVREHMTYKGLEVFEGDEYLGKVGVTYRNTEPAGDLYFYTNDRVSKAMERRDTRHTTNIKVAVKGILDSFGAKTDAELVTPLETELTSVAHEAFYPAYRAFSQAAGNVKEAALNYALANWEQFRPYVGAHGNVDLPKLHREKDETEKLMRSVGAKDAGILLLGVGEEYIAKASGIHEHKRITVSQLSDTQRANLGILKLVADKTALPGIGVRKDERTFFVCN